MAVRPRYARTLPTTLKLVGLTIPCVTGPYTSVPCTVRLLSNRWRQVDTVNSSPLSLSTPIRPSIRRRLGGSERDGYQHRPKRFGLFEPSLKDERYLPFEGAGVISRAAGAANGFPAV